MGIAGPRVLDSWLTRGPVYSWEGLGATAGRHLRETDWMACSPGLVGGGYRTSFHTLNASEDWVLALPLASFPNGLASLTLSSCSSWSSCPYLPVASSPLGGSLCPHCFFPCYCLLSLSVASSLSSLFSFSSHPGALGRELPGGPERWPEASWGSEGDGACASMH